MVLIFTHKKNYIFFKFHFKSKLIMDGTIGEIRLFAANFAPKNWAFCDGSLIPISRNTALFSILGTTYGGDGKTTFALPNLKGRSAVGAGQGPGLSFYELGEQTGVNAVTLSTLNLPPHTHSASGSIVVPAFSDGGDTGSPGGNVLAAKANMYTSEAGDTAMKPANVSLTVAVSGGSMPFSIEQPSLGMNYIICMYGMYPPRG